MLLRQQLQWRGEVVSGYVDDVGVQRVSVDRQAQRRHVHTKLVGAPGPRRQPVQPIGPNGSTNVSALGSPASSTACKLPRRLMIRLRTTRGNTTFGSTAARARYVLCTGARENNVW